MTVLHLRGVFLPDETERDVWVVEGRLTFSRPTVPGGREADTVARGGWVLPGLVDAHCHVGISPAGFAPDDETIVAQALADRDAGALLLRDVGSPVDNRVVQRRQDLPHLIRAGRHIARPKRYIRHLGVEVEPEDLVAEVERQAAAGDGWVKLAADWIDRSRGDAADLAPVWPDDVLRDAIAPLLAAGLDSLEHGCGLTDDTVARAVEAGTAVVPTLINIDTFPRIAAQADGRYDVYAAHMRSLHSTSRQRVMAAYEAGVPVYVGTDAGGSLPHGLVRQEIRALVGAGIPQAEVVAQASWRGREWLGHAGLVEGAVADLVVYDADPRVDLDTLDAPRRSVLRGRVVA